MYAPDGEFVGGVSCAAMGSIMNSDGFHQKINADRIGKRLKLLRVALGLKPSEISAVLGIERTYWSRFENGRRPVSMDIAVLLVDRFGVTLDFIYLGKWEGIPFSTAMKIKESQKFLEPE
ncbi:MAG: helix-turn-helix transcriptional regulator [Rhodobacteraceae bacterium]|nr:helix-turn-helix transcriptional regulator [Paracoccaceae bacterium]